MIHNSEIIDHALVILFELHTPCAFAFTQGKLEQSGTKAVVIQMESRP
jgi:hypothetical protein